MKRHKGPGSSKKRSWRFERAETHADCGRWRDLSAHGDGWSHRARQSLAQHLGGEARTVVRGTSHGVVLAFEAGGGPGFRGQAKVTEFSTKDVNAVGDLGQGGRDVGGSFIPWIRLTMASTRRPSRACGSITSWTS